MKVVLPEDPDGSWRASLTGWQPEKLREVARGRYNDWREHHRMAVVRTDFGFDVLGLKRMAVIDSEGNPVPDAWVLVWVDSVYPEQIHCGISGARYGATPPTPYRQPSERYHNRVRWGWRFARTIARRARRERRRLRLKAERDAAYTRAYEEGLARHIADGFSPLTYIHDDEDAERRAREVGVRLRQRIADGMYDSGATAPADDIEEEK